MLRIVGSLLLVSGIAFAQASPESSRLFDEGRALAKEGKWAEACDRFTRSYALDRAVGTALNLGECHEKQGHDADAYRFFDEAAAASAKTDNDARTRLARQRADALAARLGTIIVKVPDPAGASLTIAGRTVAAAARVEEKVEPGDVQIIVALPGKPGITRTTHVAAGASAEVDLDAADAGASSGAAVPADLTAHAERRQTRVVAGYTLGAFGIATVATGIVLGFVAKGHYDDAVKNCTGSPPVCPQPYYTDVRDAGTLGDVGTGFAIAGIVMLGAGAALYFTAPHDVVISPSAGAQSGGVTISGRF